MCSTNIADLFDLNLDRSSSVIRGQWSFLYFFGIPKYVKTNGSSHLFLSYVKDLEN